MSNKKTVINNIVKVMMANVVSLLGSLACGFLLPKIFSMDGFGYYKIFTLYLSYTGMLHFGFPDGVLLKYGGTPYEDLDKKEFRGLTWFYMIFQSCVALILVAISFFLQGEYKGIFFFIGICTFTINVITYFQFISQASMRFNEFSVIKIVTSLLTFVGIVGMYVCYMTDKRTIQYQWYLVLYTMINAGILLFYILKYRNIIWGNRGGWTLKRLNLKILFKTGIILTVSYQVLQLILNADRQFVSLLFSPAEYAVYSFAYSLITMITTVISAIALVVFPTLKQLSKERAMDFFERGILGVQAIVLLCLGGYFPLAKIISSFLPNYIPSLTYLKIIFPGLVFSSCITIVIFTYYKILDYNVQFFCIGIIILLLAILLNYGAWKIGGTASAISYASMVTFIIWYVISIAFLKLKYPIKIFKNLCYMILMSLIFYIVVFRVENLIFGFFLYEVFFFGMTAIIFYKDIQAIGFIKVGRK